MANNLSNLNQKQQAQLQQLIEAINGANSKAKLEQAVKENSNSNLNNAEVQKAKAENKYAQQEAINNIKDIINQANADAKAAAAEKEARQANNGFPPGDNSTDDVMARFEKETFDSYSRQEEISQAEQEEKRLQIKLDYERKHMKFMPTKKLASMDFEPETLKTYVKSYIKQNAIQNNFNYNDRDKKSKFGLIMATLIYGNLHYICTSSRYDNREALMSKVRNSLMEMILSSKSKSLPSKMALGMLDAFDNGELEYDKMPTEEQLDAFAEKYSSKEFLDDLNNRINDFDPDDTGIEEDADESEFDSATGGSEYYDRYDNPAEFSEDNYTAQVLFTNPYDRNVKLNPRSTQRVMRLDPSKFVDVEVPKYSTIERFQKKLFESRNGTAYEFKKRWALVLNEVKRLYPNASMVTRVAIMGTQLTVNGNLILLDNVLGGDYDIQLIDILQIRDTFKKFPMIQYLILDNEATQKMIIEYGQDAKGIWKMFQENKPLKAIGLIPANNGQPVNYNRDSFAQTAESLDKQLATEKWRMNMEMAFASKNPRLHEKSPGYHHKIWQSGKTFGGKAWTQACRNLFDDKNPKVLRWIGWSALAVAAIGVGGVLSLPGAIGDAFRKLKK